MPVNVLRSGKPTIRTGAASGELSATDVERVWTLQSVQGNTATVAEQLALADGPDAEAGIFALAGHGEVEFDLDTGLAVRRSSTYRVQVRHEKGRQAVAVEEITTVVVK